MSDGTSDGDLPPYLVLTGPHGRTYFPGKVPEASDAYIENGLLVVRTGAQHHVFKLTPEQVERLKAHE